MGLRVLKISLLIALIQLSIVLIEIFSWPLRMPSFLKNNSDNLILLRRHQGLILIIGHLIEKKFQGFSLASIPGFLSSILLFFAFYLPQNPTLLKILFGLGAVFMIIHLNALVYYGYYPLLPLRGRYKAGYYRAKSGNVMFAVFYPSEKASWERPTLLDNRFALAKFYEPLRGPKQNGNIMLHRLATDYMTRYRTNASLNVPIAPPKDENSKKYIPVIFSHGLTANTNSYSSLCTNLASLGYIVFVSRAFGEFLGSLLCRDSEY